MKTHCVFNKWRPERNTLQAPRSTFDVPDVNHSGSPKESIDFCGTDEVVVREALDGVRRVVHVAAAPGYRQHRMVVLGDCDLGHGIGEIQCLAVFRKFEAPRDLESVIAEHPVIMYGVEQLANGLGRQRLGPAFTRLASFLREIITHTGIIEKNRPRRAGMPEEIGPGGDS